METVVLIAGYVLLLATFNFSLQVAFLLGATNFPDLMEHKPVSLQDFFPVEGVVMIFVSVVFEYFLTEVINTLKPGRAVMIEEAET